MKSWCCFCRACRHRTVSGGLAGHTKFKNRTAVQLVQGAPLACATQKLKSWPESRRRRVAQLERQTAQKTLVLVLKINAAFVGRSFLRRLKLPACWLSEGSQDPRRREYQVRSVSLRSPSPDELVAPRAMASWSHKTS